jgi:Ca-activated chloride channel family protein
MSWLEWWQTWHFAAPIWFAAILLWPLIQSFWPRRGFPTEQASSPIFRHTKIGEFMQAQPVMSTQSGVSSWGLWSVRLLKLAILISLLSALAQPQRLVERPPQTLNEPVRDIAIVLESSVSFVLEDYQLNDQPASRMQVVKAVLDQFVQGLQDNRFSLSLYAEQAYTLVPMTFDSEAMRFSLQRLQPYLAGRTDQAMGAALGLALREVADQKTGIQKRLVVLVSDGLQTQSEMDLVAITELAQNLKVPIYTIGIGASSQTADLRDSAGLLYQPLETESLTLLAERTGGAFYQVGGREDLQQVLAEIERNEGVPRQDANQARWQTEDLYIWPLTWTLTLMLVWWLITSGGRRWNR